MARSTGVEPATARFVAEYSIQLSYERKRAIIQQVSIKIKVSISYQRLRTVWYKNKVCTLCAFLFFMVLVPKFSCPQSKSTN